MTVNKEYLERKVSKLNEWMQSTPTTHFMFSQKVQNRNYYVGKIIQMDEQGLNTIKI